MQESKGEKLHFPNLDALRTLAFLAVFFYHSFHTEYQFIKENPVYRAVNSFFKHGDLGVNFFFVLSGFLITHLLIREENRNEKIKLVHFYMRRVLRIWPLYFLTVLFGFVIFPIIKSVLGAIPYESADPILFLTFLSNFNNIWNGLPDASMLGVLWSVSIEEQFYLFWPLLLILFRRRRLGFIAGLLVFNVAFRWIYFDNYNIIYFHSFSVLGNLAIGGLFGYLTAKGEQVKSFFSNVGRATNILVYLTFVVVVIFRREVFNSQIMIALENLLFSLFFVWVIMEQVYAKTSVIKFGKLRYLDFWGKYTYGLYCLHFIGILVSTNTTKLLGVNQNIYMVLIGETVFALFIAHVIAFFSYQWMEKPFLRMKTRRFS